MRIRNRRRADRHVAGWNARYRIAPDDIAWHECKALDVSEAGVAFEVHHVIELGRELVVELQVGDDAPGGVLLLGTVRNITHQLDGSVRVGVQFESCTPLERSVLLRLLERALVPDRRQAEPPGSPSDRKVLPHP
jgi:hypothetical protein